MTATATTPSPSRDEAWPWQVEGSTQTEVPTLAVVAAGACAGVLLAAAGQQLFRPAGAAADLLAILLATTLAGLVVPSRLARGLALTASLAAVLPSLLAELALGTALLPLPRPATEIPGLRWQVALAVAVVLSWTAALAPIAIARSVADSIGVAIAVARGMTPMGLPVLRIWAPTLPHPSLPSLPWLSLPRLRRPWPSRQFGRMAGHPRAAVSDRVSAPVADPARLLDRLLARHGGLTLLLVGTDRVDADAGPILATAARRLRAWAPTGAMVFGIEVGVLALAIPHSSGSGDHCTRVCALLAEPMSTDEGPRPVPLRLGWASSTEATDGASLIAIAERALRALSVAAQAETGATAASAAPLTAQRREAAELEIALRRGQLRTVFRPLLGIGDRAEADRIVAVEVLPRWHRNDGTLFSAAELGTIASSGGLITPLLRQILDGGLDAITGWYGAARTVGRLAATIPNGADLPQVAEVVTQVLQRRSLPGSCLVLHLPADCLAGSRAGDADHGGRQADRDAADALRRLDVQLVLIEVGQGPREGEHGVAAVRLVTRLAAPLLRFEPGRPEVAEAEQIVAAWHDAGVRVLVGGVTTVAELARARDHGVDAVHGALVGVPSAARDLTAQLPSAHRPITRRPGEAAAMIPRQRRAG